MAPKAKAAALAAAKATPVATAEAAPAAPATEAAQTAEAAPAAPATEAAQTAEAAPAAPATAETATISQNIADILRGLEEAWEKETMTLAGFAASADIETLVKVGYAVTGMPTSVLASLGRVGKGLLITALEAHPAWDRDCAVNTDGQPVSKLGWVLEKTCLRELAQAVSLFAGVPLSLSRIATDRPAGPAVKVGPNGTTIEGRRGRYPVLITVNGVQHTSWADAYKALTGGDAPAGQSAARAFLRAYRDAKARPEVVVTAPSGLAPDVAKLAEEAGVTVTT